MSQKTTQSTSNENSIIYSNELDEILLKKDLTLLNQENRLWLEPRNKDRLSRWLGELLSIPEIEEVKSLSKTRTLIKFLNQEYIITYISRVGITISLVGSSDKDTIYSSQAKLEMDTIKENFNVILEQMISIKDNFRQALDIYLHESFESSIEPELFNRFIEVFPSKHLNTTEHYIFYLVEVLGTWYEFRYTISSNKFTIKSYSK